MVRVRSIETDNNARDIGNVLADTDDLCWFSNGAASPRIVLGIRDYVGSVRIEFQRGFQPRTVSVGGAGIATLTKEESTAVIAVGGHVDTVEIVLGASFDPYGRFCIYRIAVE